MKEDRIRFDNQMFASTVSQCFYQQFIVSQVMGNLLEGLPVTYATISLLI